VQGLNPLAFSTKGREGNESNQGDHWGSSASHQRAKTGCRAAQERHTGEIHERLMVLSGPGNILLPKLEILLG
jgi:hypothetical protein